MRWPSAARVSSLPASPCCSWPSRSGRAAPWARRPRSTSMMRWRTLAVSIALAALPFACRAAPEHAKAVKMDEYYGTLEPFAAESIYFVMTDRFVNGDNSNDQRDQGGPDPLTRSFARPLAGAPAGDSDNVGYLGGDFKGVVDNADYIRDMGFTSVWVT